MAFAQEKLYTIDDIYALPDGKRAELIPAPEACLLHCGPAHR